MKAIDMIELVTCVKFAYHYFSYGLNDYIDVVVSFQEKKTCLFKNQK